MKVFSKEFWMKLIRPYEDEEFTLYADSVKFVCKKCECKYEIDCEDCPVMITYDALKVKK